VPFGVLVSPACYQGLFQETKAPELLWAEAGPRAALGGRIREGYSWLAVILAKQLQFAPRLLLLHLLALVPLQAVALLLVLLLVWILLLLLVLLVVCMLLLQASLVVTYVLVLLLLLLGEML
jgi:hypothetical protein